MRNVNSEFLKAVFMGTKSLLKNSQLKHVEKIFGFKNLSTERILANYPNQNLARRYLPDSSSDSNLDRKFVLTVDLPGTKITGSMIRDQPLQGRTASEPRKSAFRTTSSGCARNSQACLTQFLIKIDSDRLISMLKKGKQIRLFIL